MADYKILNINITDTDLQDVMLFEQNNFTFVRLL